MWGQNTHIHWFWNRATVQCKRASRHDDISIYYIYDVHLAAIYTAQLSHEESFSRLYRTGYMSVKLCIYIWYIYILNTTCWALE